MSYRLDLSGVGEKLAPHLLHYAEAVATELRDEIVSQMDPGPGPRTGHEYPKPDAKGTYTASAPGEPPAVRTGQYRDSWQVAPAVVQGEKIVAAAVSDLKTEDGNHYLGEILEYGTTKMAPRPHIGPALQNVAQRHGGRVTGGAGGGR